MRSFHYIFIGVLLSASAHAQTPSAPPAATTAQPTEPKPMPVVEYDSGVIIPMAAPWKRPGKEGTIWAVNGVAEEGKFIIRFPFAIEPTPGSLDALYERELQALQKDRAWKKEKKTVSDAAPALTAPSLFRTRQLSIESNANTGAWTTRHLYVQTPDGKMLALECSLPAAAVSQTDFCAQPVLALALVPEADLLRGRDRQRATDMDTPCSVVNGEIERYKAANPGKPLKEMYRFTMANGIFMAMAMNGKNSSMQNVIALSKAYPDIVAGTEKTCLERPTLTFTEALGEGIKSIPKPTAP